MKQRNKVYYFEQINFHDLMKRYVNKEQLSVGDLEGIYSVSMVVYKKGKGVLSSTEKEKVSENYKQVAIIKVMDGANRAYVEVHLDKNFLPSYSIRGEFRRMAPCKYFDL